MPGKPTRKKASGASGSQKRTTRSRAKPPSATKTKTSQARTRRKTVSEQEVVIAPAPTQEQISLRAYEIWLRKGRPMGQDLENWLEAESELKTSR
ncbi:MAG: hypothetical protein Kow00105_07810 [Phycisphaeraceae bacterium]